MLLRPGVVLRMDISNLTLKLIFILIPGAIAGLIFEKLTVHKPWNNFKFIAQSILFGLLAYLNTGWFIKLMNVVFDLGWSTLTYWETDEIKEIVLRNVTVYENNSDDKRVLVELYICQGQRMKF